MNKPSTERRIKVIDLFAGPGGLGEGLTSHEGAGVRFEIALSIEMERYAHQTLTLRALYRRLSETGNLTPYYDYVRGDTGLQEFVQQGSVAPHYRDAKEEAQQHVLGPETRSETTRLIKNALGNDAEDWVLIGGPPCQAYSLVGRARNTNVADFEQDHRHFLYREYLEVLNRFSPPVFVMENVKGLLSSTVAGRNMFQAIMRDLSSAGEAGYRLQSVSVSGDRLEARDYVVRSERFGLPQARHRVIIVGIRNDLKDQKLQQLVAADNTPTVGEVLFGLPKLRSRLSSNDSFDEWIQQFHNVRSLISRGQNHPVHAEMLANIEEILAESEHEPITDSGGRFVIHRPAELTSELMRFLTDPQLGGVLQHETRSHMAEDIARYVFASAFARVAGTSPKVTEFPEKLLPKHANINRRNVPFTDRFRVQMENQPSRTVVAHISKDGHAFIHYDTAQGRSLTVREAARLQTFPDNYFFEGPRTAQYIQVGNAVPPFLANQIAGKIAQLFTSQAPESTV